MGCRNSSLLYKAKRRRSSRGRGQRRKPEAVESQNISPQYPNETHPDQAWDFAEEHQRHSRISTERALSQNSSARQNSNYKSNTEENEEKHKIHTDYQQPTLLQDSFDPPPHSTETPIIPKNVVASENKNADIPENSTAPAHNVTKSKQKFPPSFPPNAGTNAENCGAVTPPVLSNTGTNSGNFGVVNPPAPPNTGTVAENNVLTTPLQHNTSANAKGDLIPPVPPNTRTSAGRVLTPPVPPNSGKFVAITNEDSLISERVSSVKGTPEISENNGDLDSAMKSNDTESRFPLLQKRNSSLKGELESISMKVHVGQATKSPPRRVSQVYKVPFNSETEYKKPEERMIEKVVDSSLWIPNQKVTSGIKAQPPKQHDPYAPIGKPEVWVPRSSQLANPRPPREEDIGSICFHVSTGEYRYYLRGVHLGNVDKEIAEKFSKNWPVCSGSDAKPLKQRRLQQDVPLNQRKTYISPARPYNYTGPQAQVYRGQPTYQSRGVNQGADNRYRGHVVGQPSPVYRGNYM